MLLLLLLAGAVAAAPGAAQSSMATFNVSQFSAPTEADNVQLEFKDKSLKVSRQLLAEYSTVFADKLAEHKKTTGNDKMESMKADDDYEEFVTALQVLFPDDNVATILKMADKWKFKKMSYLYLAENQLTNSKKFTTVEKLRLADQHKIVGLLEHCLQSYSTVQELVDSLESTTQPSNLSPVAQAAIMHRKVELVKEKRLWE